MSTEKFHSLMTALVFISFIGGCTYTLSSGTPSSKIIAACISNKGYTWENSGCKRLPQ